MRSLQGVGGTGRGHVIHGVYSMSISGGWGVLNHVGSPFVSPCWLGEYHLQLCSLIQILVSYQWPAIKRRLIHVFLKNQYKVVYVLFLKNYT